MSDSSISLVPSDPGFVPTADQQAAGVRLGEELRARSKWAYSEVRVLVSERPDFHHGFANLMRITCPGCGAGWVGDHVSRAVGPDRWGRWMDEDYVVGSGFALSARVVPCCGITLTLDDLVHDWPAAFGRFALELFNCDIGALEAEQVVRFERALGCSLRVVYAHI